MSSNLLGLFIGGVLPAIFFGLSGLFAKTSNVAGISLGYYLLSISFAIATVGVYCLFIFPDRLASLIAVREAFFCGLTWALGAGLVAIALTKLNSPVSQLIPLYNMNTLIGVLLGLWLFSEWQAVNAFKLIIGTVFIIIGGVLVALA